LKALLPGQPLKVPIQLLYLLEIDVNGKKISSQQPA